MGNRADQEKVMKNDEYVLGNLFPVNNMIGASFDKLVSEEVPASQRTLKIKKQYILTNLLSVVCEKVGYDGIVYCSTKEKTSVDYVWYNKHCSKRKSCRKMPQRV